MTVIIHSVSRNYFVATKPDLIKRLVHLFPHIYQTTVILIIYGQLLIPATPNISPGVEKGVLITEEAQSSFREQMLTHADPKDIQLTRTNIVSTLTRRHFIITIISLPQKFRITHQLIS